MDDDALVDVLHATADGIGAALGALADWGPSGAAGRPDQYHSDLAADVAAVAVLTGAGLGVLSEESGRHHADRPVTVVVDPLDGSTNASRRVSWWATSLCAVDGDGARVALVVDLLHGTRFQAVRGGGATCDGRPIRASTVDALGDALVGANGLPTRHFGWAQLRVLGAAALDLCAVASGALDGYVDCDTDALGPWDYLGGMLICAEAGATVVDAFDRPLTVVEHAARRTPIAGATGTLASALQAARTGTEGMCR